MKTHNNKFVNKNINRRTFVKGLAMSAMLGTTLNANMSQKKHLDFSQKYLDGEDFDLTYTHQSVNITGSNSIATAINGSIPAPILRFRENQKVKIKVSNKMNEDTSIHWHGLILPSEQDGVPFVSNGFSGIKPNRFLLKKVGNKLLC